MTPRVLYLINSLDRGGAELGLERLVDGGVFAGCELTIACLFRSTSDLSDRLGRLGSPPLILLDQDRIRISDLPLALLRLAGLMRRQRPDIVILSLPQANLLGRLASISAKPKQLISFEHNTRLAKPAYELGYRLTSGLVDWMFADAPSTAAAVARSLYCGPPARTTIVPLISFPEAGPKSSRVGNKTFTVVNAGRFTAVKNQQALIRAAGLLRDGGLTVRLTLYGEGPERDAYLRLAAELGISDQISLPGFVADWWTRPADAFVLASQHEGLCIALLEAMHAGIPVATPVVGGIADYANAQNALVLSDTTPQNLASAIATLHSSPSAALVRAIHARETVAHLYGASSVREAYRAINTALLAVGSNSVRAAEVGP